jgi:hypothetical protein
MVRRLTTRPGTKQARRGKARWDQRERERGSEGNTHTTTHTHAHGPHPGRVPVVQCRVDQEKRGLVQGPHRGAKIRPILFARNLRLVGTLRAASSRGVDNDKGRDKTGQDRTGTGAGLQRLRLLLVACAVLAGGARMGRDGRTGGQDRTRQRGLRGESNEQREHALVDRPIIDHGRIWGCAPRAGRRRVSARETFVPGLGLAWSWLFVGSRRGGWKRGDCLSLGRQAGLGGGITRRTRAERLVYAAPQSRGPISRRGRISCHGRFQEGKLV